MATATELGLDPMRFDPQCADDVNERGHPDFGYWYLTGSGEDRKQRFWPVCKSCGCCKPPALSPADPPECPDCQDPLPWY